jgi:hypothetical protein
LQAKYYGFRGSEVQGSGFKVQRFRGSRFRVQGSRFKVQGSRFRVQGSGFRVQGSGFKVQGSEVQGSEVQGSTPPAKETASQIELGTPA